MASMIYYSLIQVSKPWKTLYFIKEISDLKPQRPVTMASFGIGSLFTNVALIETNDMKINKTSSLLKLIEPEQENLQEIIGYTSSQFSVYLSCLIYTQVDGVAMGSPLGPCDAYTFLCYHEEVWMSFC